MYKEKLLSEIIVVQNGYAFKTSDFVIDGAYPVVKIKNILDSKIDLVGCDYTNFPPSSLEKFKVEFDDILISMTGSRASQPNSAVGKVGRMREKKKVCYLNQRVGKIIVIDPQKTNQQFLFYFLNRKEINLALANSASGSANQANISPQNITSLKMPVPPKYVQDKVVDVFYSIDNKIENNELQIILFHDILNNVYQNWFNDFSHPNDTDVKDKKIPIGWLKSKIYNEAVEIKIKNKDNYDYPVLSVVKEGEFKLSEDVFTKQVYSKSTTNYKIVRKNQVGYNPARANIGSIAMLKDKEVGLVSPIYTVFEMKESITPTFFYYYMKQPIFLEMIKHHAIGTTRQNFPFEAFKMFDIVVPPMELQLEFEKIAEPIEKKIALLKEENKVLAEIRDTLLPKLMSGELPVEVGEE